MAKQDIKAGSAFVELVLKGGAKFSKALDGAGQKLQSFGKGAAMIGGSITASGTAITGALSAAVAHFASVGSELADMSARTGVAGSTLAELGYAAEQTGAELVDVEKALTAMAKKGNTKSFEEQAAAIAAIDDPVKQAKAAMDAWGKSGMKLIPMAENLAELRKQAQEKGLVPSDDAISAADALGDAIDDVWKSVNMLVFEIGHALAASVLASAKKVVAIVGACIKWVRANQNVIVVVKQVGLALLVAGSIITAVGGAIIAVGMTLSGIAAIFGAIGAAAAVLLSPLGIITAALVTGAIVWAKYTESGQAAMSGLTAFFTDLYETVQQTVGGISDALAAGDLALAADIAIEGLKVAFLKGLAALSELVGGAFGDFLGTIGQQLVEGDISGIWETTILGMKDLWFGFCEGLVAVFTTAARAVVDVWQKATSAISDAILATSAQGGALGGLASKVLGVDMAEEQKRADALAAGFAKTKYGTGGAKKTDVLGDAQASARGQLAGVADEWRKSFDNMDRAAQARSGAASGAFRERTAGGASGAGDAATAAQSRLDELTTKAKAAREAVDAKSKDKIAGAVPTGDNVSVVKKVEGTFSAAAAMGLGGMGGSPAERTAKASEKSLVLLESLVDATGRVQQTIREEGAIQP